jgi:hypothetical protein
MGTTSGPPDHPGYRMVNMLDNVDLADAQTKGFRLATDATPNIIESGSLIYGVFSWGYSDHGH